MASKKRRKKAKKEKTFSLVPKKKKKPSQDKRAVMGRECFSVSYKSQVIFDQGLIEVIRLVTGEQSKLVRKTFNIINNSFGTEPKEEEIRESFGVDGTEARNIIKIAKGIYDSQKALVEEQYIPDTRRDIKSLCKQISNQTNRLNKAQGKKAAKNLKKLNFLKDRLNRKVQRLACLKNQLEIGKFSVCFGTKKLMRQFSRQLEVSRNENLSEAQRNEAKQEYDYNKADFQFNRDSEYFVEGHADQAHGNQKIKLFEKDNSLTLRINIPDRFSKAVGKKSILIQEVSFVCGNSPSQVARRKEIYHALRRFEKKGSKRVGNKTEYPVTHRLKLVKTSQGIGVQVIMTIKVKKAEIVSSRLNGAMGVDFNQHSLDWGVVDYYGNPIASGKIALSTQDRNSEQTKDMISKAIDKVFEIAQQYEVPIYFEDLQFKNNSSRMKAKGKKFARMASNLPFARFREMVQQKSYRNGIKIGFVNPAFTSVIGLTNYVRKYGLSSGSAAGVVIARRGLGFSHKIPQYLLKAGFLLEDGKPNRNWANWGKLAKRIMTIGKQNRHAYYRFGWLDRVNCSEKGNGSPSVGGRNTSSRGIKSVESTSVESTCGSASEKSPRVTGAPESFPSGQVHRVSNDAQL